MKASRQAQILELVRETRIESQEQLRGLLHRAGFEVTQATLSRDIRELGLAKIADPGGGSFYAPPPDLEVIQPHLEQLVPALLLSMEGTGNLLVIHTPAGSANALASAIDREDLADILGTIAGDDTLLVVTRNERSRRRVERLLRDRVS